MTSSSPKPSPGQVIGGRYRVQTLIGRGGMGLVYAATHELTGRRVALKLMTSSAEDSPVLHERFLSEARIAATVRHPNIVDVLDMGVHEGVPYLVLELLEGVSLEKLLEGQRRLSVEQALAWLLPIIGALSVLHEAGIVHRDVKPSNIFLSSLPRHPMQPKLLDFGLARVVSDLRLTRSGSVIGTPLYMAPEHAAGQATGPQADIWSIGVVLYEVLAGCSPFQYTDRASLATQVLAGVVRPFNQARPDLPELLSVAIGRALHRDLTRRYPDMRSFARALHGAAVASGIAVPDDPDPIGLPDYRRWKVSDQIAATTHEQVRSTPSRAKSSGSWVAEQPSRAAVPASWKRVWIGLGLGAALLCLAWFAMRSPGERPTARPEPVVAPSALGASRGVSDLRTAPIKPTVESIVLPPSPPEPVRDRTPVSEAAPPRAAARRGSTRRPARAAPKSQDQYEVEAEWK
ncbi:MAG TPA: protein kinase [Polyangiales bacterium]